MPFSDQILRILAEAAPNPVSGELIATQLGHVTRVSIHQHIQKLRQQGFVIDAQRNKGYSLSSVPPRIHPVLLEHEFKRFGYSQNAFSFHNTIDSTNDEATRQLSIGRQTPFAIIAQQQSKGRGRLGRAWHSVNPENLYVSLAFRPKLPPVRMQPFTLWMGVSACEYINSHLSLKKAVGVKWPNDLYHKGKKLCGILSEARMDADHVRDIVSGIGINVNKPSTQLPPEIKARATNLAEAVGHDIEINAFAAGLIVHLFQAFGYFVADTYQEKFRKLWKRYDILKGKAITLHEGDRILNGVAEGINEESALIFLQDDGTRKVFHAGDVSLSAQN